LVLGAKMKKLIWEKNYSVGVEKFDSQHCHLFEITNKLIDYQDSLSTQIVCDTLAEMIKYAREHFADEEILMNQYDYPETASHTKQHDYFINTTAELAIGFMDNQNTTGQEIAEFLLLWLTNHILKTDMKYKDFFRSKIPIGVL
jgi:hemerythrin